jgi:hypothetical protein
MALERNQCTFYVFPLTNECLNALFSSAHGATVPAVAPFRPL